MKDCIKIQYQEPSGITYLWADKCHLEYSGINGERWFFYRGTEIETINGLSFTKPKLVKILGVRRLTKAGLDSAKKLTRRPYLKEVMNQCFIDLYSANIDDYNSLPDDTIQIWTIAKAHDSWVIERSSGATLHIFNNGERSVKAGNFHKALRKLFPKQTITIYRKLVTIKKEDVE